MNIKIVFVEIQTINTDSSTIQFYYNGRTCLCKYIYNGNRSDITSPSALKAYVMFDEDMPLFAIVTIEDDVAKMLEERNKKFYCGIMT